MITSLCVIVRRPGGEERATLGIRTAWAGWTAAIDTQLLCIEDGVFNLVDNSGYNTQLLKDFLNEGRPVYGLVTHLAARGLRQEDLLHGVQVIGAADVAGIVADCDAVATF